MTFSKKDSALGEQCGSVAKIVKGTNAKFANLPQFSQSYHSPTANLRILEEESQANQSSLRDFALAKSWQSISAKADSSKASKTYFASAKFMDCHAIATALARNDRNNAKAQNADSRIFTQAAQSVEILKSATNLKTQQDSRICDEKPLLCERVQGRILGRM